MVGGGRALERGGPARGMCVVEAGDGRGSEEKVVAKGGKGEVRGGEKGTRLHDEAAAGMLGGWRKAEAAGAAEKDGSGRRRWSLTGGDAMGAARSSTSSRREEAHEARAKT